MTEITEYNQIAEYRQLANAPLAEKRKALIQLYGMLFERLGMSERTAATVRMIQQAPAAQIEIEINTLETGQFQKVVHALITCEPTPEETEQIRALYEGIFYPYMELQAAGRPIPREDLEWAYNEIFNCIEGIRASRAPKIPIEPKRIGKTASVTKNISMTQTHRAWLQNQAEAHGVSISRVVQSLIDEKLNGDS